MKKEKPAKKNRNVFAIFVVFVLIVIVGFQMVHVYGDLKDKRAEEKAISAQYDQTTQENASMQADLDRAGGSDIYKEKAREELGLAEEGERIFYDVNN